MGRRNRAAPTAADVADVGEGRFQIFAEFVVERHMPHLLVLASGAGLHLLTEGVVIGEQADVNVAKGNDNGTGDGWTAGRFGVRHVCLVTNLSPECGGSICSLLAH